MPEFRRPAVKIQQGKRTLFLTSFTVGDFLTPEFYKVDRLDVEESTGVQRLLKQRRVRSFGNDMVDADGANEAFLPTSIFLATQGSISYDEQTKELFFGSEPHFSICPFDVVDGQHRLEGLRFASERSSRLLDFPVSVVIAHDMSETEKMLQFITVNMKQEKVDKGVEQHITSRFTKMLSVETIPHLPDWLRRQVNKGTDDRGLEIALKLNGDDNSPWRGRIQFADEEKSKRHTIAQGALVGSLKRLVLNRFHPYNDLPINSEKRLTVFVNYWRAIDNVFVGNCDAEDGRNAPVVYKTNGVEFFGLIFAPVLNVLAKGRSFTVDDFESALRQTEDCLTTEAAVVMAPEFWVPGHGASSQNRAGIQHLAAEFSEAIREAFEEEGVRV